jgi:transposase
VQIAARASTTRVNHTQKTLDQMNIQWHQVISDILGQAGLAIVDAILAGERDPSVRAKLRNDRSRRLKP